MRRIPPSPKGARTAGRPSACPAAATGCAVEAAPPFEHFTPGFYTAGMSIHQSVLELIGGTPIIKAQRLDTGVCELYLKLESQNPGGPSRTASACR